MKTKNNTTKKDNGKIFLLGFLGNDLIGAFTIPANFTIDNQSVTYLTKVTKSFG